MPRKPDYTSRRLKFWIETSRNPSRWKVLRKHVELREPAIRRAAEAIGVNPELAEDRDFLLGILAEVVFLNPRPSVLLSMLEEYRPSNDVGRPKGLVQSRCDKKVIMRAWDIQDEKGLSFDKALTEAIKTALQKKELGDAERTTHKKRLKRLIERLTRDIN
jgi:hypothetical protein